MSVERITMFCLAYRNAAILFDKMWQDGYKAVDWDYMSSDETLKTRFVSNLLPFNRNLATFQFRCGVSL